jgi:hypothetical protein
MHASLVFSEIETGMLLGVFQFHVKQAVVCRLSQFLRQLNWCQIFRKFPLAKISCAFHILPIFSRILTRL